MLFGIDLSSDEVKAEQSVNVAIFRKRQLRVWFGFGSVFFGPLVLDAFLGKQNDVVIVGFVFVSIIFVVFALLLYKCPNCATQPLDVSCSIADDARYNKGVHSFPVRCRTCGFYLSGRALKKDIQRQKQANLYGH